MNKNIRESYIVNDTSVSVCGVCGEESTAKRNAQGAWPVPRHCPHCGVLWSRYATLQEAQEEQRRLRATKQATQ